MTSIVSQILLKAGQDINGVVENGLGVKETALHCAVRSIHVSTVRLLLDLGAKDDVDGSYFGYYEGTPIEYARSMERERLSPKDVDGVEAIIDMLEKRGEGTDGKGSH